MELRQEGKTQAQAAEMSGMTRDALAKAESREKRSNVTCHNTLHDADTPSDTPKPAESTPSAESPKPVESPKSKPKPSPDVRIKIPRSEIPRIVERVKAGESVAQVAAESGLRGEVPRDETGWG